MSERHFIQFNMIDMLLMVGPMPLPSQVMVAERLEVFHILEVSGLNLGLGENFSIYSVYQLSS
jgi:hypothetical protein